MIILSDKDCKKLDQLEKAFYRGAAEYCATLEDSDSFYDPFAKIMQLLRTAEYRKVEADEDKEATQDNSMLTLEELLQIDAEPVYLVLANNPGRWVIRPANGWVDGRNPEPMVLINMQWYPHSAYGKLWAAYRKKP